MRILMLSWEFPPYVVGGMGKHVAELAPMLSTLTLDGEPLQIDVLTTRADGGAAIEQITPHLTAHRVNVPPIDAHDLYNSVIANNASLIEYGIKLGEQHHYDLIHMHDWLVGEAGITLKHQWKTPLVATIHATERGRHQGYLPSDTSYHIDQMEGRIGYEAWRVIICSEYMRGEVHYFFNVPYDKMDVIANGFDMKAIVHPSPAEIEALRQQYAPRGEKLLFFVGRATHEKGMQVLIAALPGILATYKDVRLVVAGKNGNKMWPLAHDLKVDQVVDFLGFISDAQRDLIYHIADAAVFPSLYEPFGIVALEAMAQECNVIASNVGGLGEVVIHEQNGLNVYPNDPQSIVWAVNRLFTDPAAAAQRREFARTQTLALYQWDKIATQTMHVYQNVVQARAQVPW
ncbi:MAG: glycosyltransferase family 4 protein [Chloroflexi bacterium]|nr:glycosyltransferase family 4 protein [Chloroflexota bacterium]